MHGHLRTTDRVGGVVLFRNASVTASPCPSPYTEEALARCTRENQFIPKRVPIYPAGWGFTGQVAFS